MLSKKVQDSINDQINFELFSAYIYASMAAYFQGKNLNGFANWMQIQTQEELAHVKRFYDYVYDRGGQVVLKAIKAPKTTWKSPLAAFEDAYHHECIVSGRINKMVELAEKEKDHATVNMLQWFVSEQVEEEATASGVVDTLKLANNAPGAIFMLDRELGQRTFAPPAQ